ncbi:MAG TPA: polysaccharide deacetylase family protein [Gemmatimonadales bacterium]|nr:polysaccharide deacetylase family protein [Gemmatimonadales bacterium]
MQSSLLYAGLRAIGLPTLARRLRDAGVILCYHNIVGRGTAAPQGEPSLHLPVNAFRRQMLWLARHYQVVPLVDLISRLEQRRTLRRVAAVTFDDAYLGVFEHAWPLLCELQIPATVFVVANAPTGGEPFWWDHPAVQAAATPQRRDAWLGELRGNGAAILRSLAPAAEPALPNDQKPADWRTIARAAQAGLTLGVHSRTHRALPTLSDAELGDELVRSREVIARETGTAAEVFAYPYGAWNSRLREAVHAAGYRAAVTLDYGLNRAGADLLALPRVNVPAGISDAALEAWLAGLRLRLPAAHRPDPLLESHEITDRQTSVGWERA